MELKFLQAPQIEFLREGKYIQDNETPQQRFQEIVDKVREYEPMYSEGLADRIEYMIDKNILSLSTPVLANFGRPLKKGKNSHPLPASCYIVTVGDSIADIYNSIGQLIQDTEYVVSPAMLGLINFSYDIRDLAEGNYFFVFEGSEK